mmetsp:Transcript_9946/g.28926  ORF Transcript_9946/g.28926 Transcript_9946/m.28926 type:complete len:258 (-) Transcript_9946:894-1667(-)
MDWRLPHRVRAAVSPTATATHLYTLERAARPPVVPHTSVPSAPPDSSLELSPNISPASACRNSSSSSIAASSAGSACDIGRVPSGRDSSSPASFRAASISASSSIGGGGGPARSSCRSSSVSARFLASSKTSARQTASGQREAGGPPMAARAQPPWVSLVQTGSRHSSARRGMGRGRWCSEPRGCAPAPPEPPTCRPKKGWSRRAPCRAAAGSSRLAPPPSRSLGLEARSLSTRSAASGGIPSGMWKRRAWTRRKVR